jgi:hypothetical protein
MFVNLTISLLALYGRFLRASQSFNALSYDDKILDGFYDVWAIGGKPPVPTIPSLVELQEQPFSHGAKTEAVLVNRAQDSELAELGQKALVMAADFRSQTSQYIGRVLIQRLAILVANHMGGPVFDPENVLLKYQSMSSSLRASITSAVMPLGRLTIGLARHRALLFKVSNLLIVISHLDICLLLIAKFN